MRVHACGSRCWAGGDCTCIEGALRTTRFASRARTERLAAREIDEILNRAKPIYDKFQQQIAQRCWGRCAGSVGEGQEVRLDRLPALPGACIRYGVAGLAHFVGEDAKRREKILSL